MYHKDTTRYHKESVSFYYKDIPGIPRGTMRYLRVPNDTSRYHKDFLEYSAMSLKHTTRNP
jgi:hypothetical protein